MYMLSLQLSSLMRILALLPLLLQMYGLFRQKSDIL